MVSEPKHCRQLCGCRKRKRALFNVTLRRRRLALPQLSPHLDHVHNNAHLLKRPLTAWYRWSGQIMVQSALSRRANLKNVFARMLLVWSHTLYMPIAPEASAFQTARSARSRSFLCVASFRSTKSRLSRTTHSHV